ncbi:MFS transporter [Actinocatenispora comari]|jgi:MFS family permease|uniref:Putative proline/betaine transporter n=1 Tax=Actinocatenispora comari TaxID=2807577 RepID=A0A8J4EJA6_9ACTN|nr:MFS transporter [Actinocatenispora comari]GIL26106.1 MFS transporter [Actinocatenispora comari]
MRGRADEAGATSIRQIAVASLIGTVVEWYDFFLYATMATLVFNKAFFPTGNELLSTLIAFTTFAAGFVTRPIGGLVFGHFGDRLGRKQMLVITMMIMGGATFLMGLLPTYGQIGVAAPILLLVLRMLQGIGLGGEWGGAMLMTAEHSPTGRRGWYTSWPQLGVPIGLLASTLVVNVLGRFGSAAFASWGWRIGFLLSALLVGIGMFIRLRVSEPPAFAEIVRAKRQVRLPLADVFRRHPKTTLLAVGARFSESLTFNIYNAFIITYLTVVLKLDKSVALDGLLIAAVVGFFAILVAGRLSDRIGRRPVFIAGAAIAAATAFPLFGLIDTGRTGLIWLALVIGWGIAACTMFGAEGALFAELYPTRVRYSGISIVYQLGVLPSGAIAPAVATALVAHYSHQSWPVATYVLVVGVISVVSLVFLPETHRRDLHAEPSAAPVPDVTPAS